MTAHLTSVWVDRDEDNALDGTPLNAASLCHVLPMNNAQHARFIQKSALHTGFVLKQNTALKLIVNGVHHVFECKQDLAFNAATLLDADQALLAGKDYYIYACIDSTSGQTPKCKLVTSLNSTFPKGYTADNSRKIGGFHTLCANVGTIGGHPLSDFVAGDILPDSFWTLACRPATCGPEGMVYLEKLGIWVDIYLQSGTGSNTASVYGASVTKSRSWDQHSEDLAAVGKRMLWDNEFTLAAWGTQPYQTVRGVVDPVTTGGKVNGANRRIISNIGCEDMCGCYWQWIHQSTAGSGTVWANAVPSDQGKQYGPPLAMIAGGAWNEAANAGPRCRGGTNSRAHVHVNLSSRGAARAM